MNIPQLASGSDDGAVKIWDLGSFLDEFGDGSATSEEQKEIIRSGFHSVTDSHNAMSCYLNELQRWAKQWSLGCEKFVPGPSWPGLLLSKTSM